MQAQVNSSNSDKPIKTLLFSIKDVIGILGETLQVFKNHGINMRRIESRPSCNDNWDYDLIVSVSTSQDSVIDELVSSLGNMENVGDIKVLSTLSTTKDYSMFIALIH